MSGNTDEGIWDDALGSVDEAVARSTDNEPGGGLIDGTAGALDHAAGSIDEAVARSTDDTEGGGLWDGFAGTLDHAAGSTDEAVGRQFDDTEGGGFANWFANQGAAFGDWAAGSTDEAVGRSTNWQTLIIIAIIAFYLAKESDIDFSGTAKKAGEAAKNVS